MVKRERKYLVSSHVESVSYGRKTESVNLRTFSDGSTQTFTSLSRRMGSPAETYTNIGYLILAFILLVFVLRYFFSGQSIDSSRLTFSAFLDWLRTTNFESLPIIDLMKPNTLYLGDKWIVMDELRVFINSILAIVKFLLFIGGACINGLTTISQFLAFILGV